MRFRSEPACRAALQEKRSGHPVHNQDGAMLGDRAAAHTGFAQEMILFGLVVYWKQDFNTHAREIRSTPRKTAA